MFNATILDQELKAAGLRIHGCSSDGRIDWIQPPTAKELKLAEQVKKNHDPNLKSRIEELREKRRAGKKFTAAEKDEILDLLLSI